MAPLGASSLGWLWLSGRCSSSAGSCSVTLPTLIALALGSSKAYAVWHAALVALMTAAPAIVPLFLKTFACRENAQRDFPSYRSGPNFWVLPIRTLITPVFQRLVK